MNKVHTTVVALALAGAAFGAWWLQNRPATPAAQAATGGARAPGGPGAAAGPVAVEIGRAEVTRLEEDAQAVGTLRSNQGVMLRPEVGGRIAKLGFADGQRVRRGQLLVQLDDALQQAQAQQANAQANIARTNLQRNRELVAQNFVSQSVVDQAQANLEVAEAQVALARAQLQRMKVVAPFDGIVGIRSVNIGDYVKDGADLVQVEDVSSVWVDFRLPERYLSQLKPGQAVAVNLDALPGKRYAARVEAVDSQLDASGRSLLVRAKLANTGGDLRSGMFARTRIVFAVREQAVTVPEEALVPMGEQQFLIKVVDGPNGAKLGQRMQARIGARTAGRVEVLEGVRAGDAVVVAGQARLMRGEPQPLRIVQLGGASGAGGGGPAPGAASAPAGARATANGASAPRVAFTTP
ncbi:efflux RND transporter periplasmic adaptor subunit [Aquabacterium humicola]|uniref:efflux RND transporter periplasmic adaptor subunit n=1 Tax=Aquabacterium humicola TaxID=3237377 RepID=UPI002543F336|nr:efflux RND transporter periplasmic adaptor subunit [Rubrivivax pictus]